MPSPDLSRLLIHELCNSDSRFSSGVTPYINVVTLTHGANLRFKWIYAEETLEFSIKPVEKCSAIL